MTKNKKNKNSKKTGLRAGAANHTPALPSLPGAGKLPAVVCW